MSPCRHPTTCAPGLPDVRRLARRFYDRDAREVAPELLNKVLAHGDRTGRIVEVEAYVGAVDPAAHSYRGLTPRNEVMFGPPGHLYVYFIYGMHWCCNAVCDVEGMASAVLIRALAPIQGIDEMREARNGVSDRQLCSGPAKLCQALGIGAFLNGSDLVQGPVGIYDDGVPPPPEPTAGPRVGITVGLEHHWRWYVTGDPNVSRPR